MIMLQSDRPTWEELKKNAVPSSHPGILFIDQSVKDLADKYPTAFYQFTKETAYVVYEYKCGQTTVGVKRIHGERESAEREIFIIVGWVPSNLATKNKYDQKILKDLHNQKKCTLAKVLDKERTTLEWAVFPDDNPEIIWREYLGNNANRADLGLAIWQLEMLYYILTFLTEGKKKIMAELAARFGKTIFYLAMFSLMKQQVMVVGSYYLTALSSFQKEILRYIQFKNLKCLDLSSNTFQEDFNRYQKQGNKIVILSSLCGDKVSDTVRNQNAQFIEQFTDKITVIDEADYGAHTDNCAPFVNKLGFGAPIILTTGTNSSRASNNHPDIDAFIRRNYFDLIMMAGKELKIKSPITVKFRRALGFENNIPKIIFYCSDWGRCIPHLKGHSQDLYPSFSKASEDVSKCHALWSGIYKSLIGQHENVDVNDFSLFNCLHNDTPRSVIQFVNMENKELHKLEKIARAHVSDFYDVIAVCGDKIKGKDAEQYVKDAIRVAEQNGKHVWIIASKMCQRSFSIPEINVVILTYDKGDISANNQRISRALTNGNEQKTGHVISLSIDGNRDDKITSIILDTAKNVAEQDGTDIMTGLKKVNKTLTVFQMGEDGYNLKLELDDYAKEMFASSNSHQILINNDRLFYGGILDEIELGDSFVETQKVEIPFTPGKTFVPNQNKKTKKEMSSEESQLIHKRQNKLAEITGRMNYCVKEIRKHKKSLTYETFLDLCDENQFICDTMGVSPSQFQKLLKDNYLNSSLLPFFVEHNK
jgi:hypothetical protein